MSESKGDSKAAASEDLATALASVNAFAAELKEKATAVLLLQQKEWERLLSDSSFAAKSVDDRWAAYAR